MFNRRGDPSAELVHGLRQVHDWQQWITDNRNYVRDMFVERGWMDWERSMLEGGEVPPHGFADRYLLVIGRRASLTAEDRLRLHRLNENSPDVQIITYDVMVNCLMPEAPFIPWQVMVFGSD